MKMPTFYSKTPIRHCLKAATLLLLVGLTNGCSILEGGKLLAPKCFGLEQVTSKIYVEAGTDKATQAMLCEAFEKAESSIRATYGSVTSHPIVNACTSESCYTSFGGRGSVAKVYGNRILLSPRGLNWHFIAHEWSHAEIRSRLTLRAWWHLPHWFDEGLAVAISEAPEHSESHWQFLISSNIPRPTSEELHSLLTLKQWDGAVSKYGEKTNQERKAKGEPEIRPVYTAVGHEVRIWLAKTGSAGLNRLIEQLNNGEKFDSTYYYMDGLLPNRGYHVRVAPYLTF